ncbi:transposase, partial [Escherichia coli]|uniref:transposase n=1 Tax=Escherichia coli TaxID=562 RepID=UPI0020267CC7
SIQTESEVSTPVHPSASMVGLDAGVSIQTENEVSTPVHPSASMVGLDAGVAKLATLSDGTVFGPVNWHQKNQKTLARLQRQLSRKVKFSNNWQKQKCKIQRLHSRIANI